jgi:hypothetical protein
MPDNTILIVLFSTVAAIVSTLTGLIGAFATFRLQRMDAKLDFLKDYLLHKELPGAKTFNQKLRDTGYSQIERIYLHNAGAIDLLYGLVEELDYHQHTEEYGHDLMNIRKHQQASDRVRKMTRKNFGVSLGFVLTSIVLLVFSNKLALSSCIWIVLTVFFIMLVMVFRAYIIQVKSLIE